METTHEIHRRGLLTKRRGKTVYDGVLTYYDEDGTRRFKHCERKTRGDALEALRKVRQKLESGGPKAVEADRITLPILLNTVPNEIYVAADYNEAGKNNPVLGFVDSGESV